MAAVEERIIDMGSSFESIEEADKSKNSCRSNVLVKIGPNKYEAPFETRPNEDALDGSNYSDVGRDQECSLLNFDNDGDNHMLSKSDKFRERLLQSVGEESKKKISSLLSEVSHLSDIEKLLLYLQLPTGTSSENYPPKQKNYGNPLGKKADSEVTQTYTWIQSHLEEDPDVSLPKQEVYEEYKSFCEANKTEPLCAADFGKVMKHVFPSVKPRRLGTRGNSRYCYSGLCKKIEIKAPSLPDISVKESNNKGKSVNCANEINSAACHLLFEWTEKLLGKKFSSLSDLASYLVQNMYVDNRSVAAFTILSAASIQQMEKGACTSNLMRTGGNKRRETQIHLQRKIQEKKLIKEQKKKLQEQRSLFSKLNHGKLHSIRKINCNKKEVTSDEGLSAGSDNVPNSGQLNLKDSIKLTDAEEKKWLHKRKPRSFTYDEVNTQKEQLFKIGVEQADILHNSSSKNTSDQNSVGSMDDVQGKKKRSSKMPIPRNTTPAVCITQGVPSIIIVPSLPHVHIAELGTVTPPSSATPKYKKIQPKPLSRCLSVCSVTTDKKISAANSAFVNDTHQTLDSKEDKNSQCQEQISDSTNNKHNRVDDQSSLAMLYAYKTDDLPQSENLKSQTDENINSHTAATSLNASTGSGKNCIKLHSNSTLSSNMKVLFPNEHVKHTNNDILPNYSASEIKNKNKILDLSLSEEEGGIIATIKRHSEESDNQIIVSKKPHLDDFFNSSEQLSSGSLSPWNKDGQDVSYNLSSECQEAHTAVSSGIVKTEGGLIDQEVSIHQLESDALIEYLHGTSIESGSSDFDSQNTSIQENQTPVLGVLQKSSHSSDDKGKQTHVTNKIAQLSQLRMLLERNLPSSVTKGIFLNTNKQYPSDSSVNKNHPTSVSCGSEQNETVFLNKIDSKSESEKKCSVQYKSNFARVVTSLPISANIQWQNFVSVPNTLVKNFSIIDNADGLASVIVEQNLSPNEDANKINRILKDNTKMAYIDSTACVQDANIALPLENAETEKNQLHQIFEVKCSSTQTQTPSVPPSPNTRRRAFNFMPISPRQTPISEGTAVPHSPVPSLLANNMISVAVGPSQPPSASSSPFVSPRSTPIPLSRSRHSSGQSSYSTSRQTPFQNFDSGVSSISTSPFISPQSTPVPVSRLRHNSSHGPGKTVTFSTTNSPHIIHSQSSFPCHASRSRHSSGPGGPPIISSALSPRSAPLSPMIGDSLIQTSVSFSAASSIRSRHNSASSVTPLSPVSEQISPCHTSGTHSSEILAPGKEMPLNNIRESSILILSDHIKSKEQNHIHQKISNISETTSLKPSPLISEQSLSHWAPRHQRHASSSVINQKVAQITTGNDSVSQEIQSLFKNATYSVDSSLATRSHSVPLHQMLKNLINQCSAPSTDEDYSKSHPQTPITNHSFHFPSVTSDHFNENGCDDLGISLATSIISQKRNPQTDQDAEALIQAQNATWTNISNVDDIETLSARRNLTDLLEQPLEVDLQTTLEDLKDCDNDFSKLAQELEEMNQSNESPLS